MPNNSCFAFRGYLLFFIMCAVCSSPFAQTPVLQQAMLSDNKGSDIPAPLKKIYDEEAKSWYAVSNTNNMLFVYLAVTDPLQQRKIIMNGMELWIDPRGKKNKKTGIIFPFTEMNPSTPSPTTMRPPGPRNNELLTDADKMPGLEKAIARKREMKLVGFKEDVNGMQNISHPSGVRVALYFVKDTLLYTAQIPLNMLAEPLAAHARISIGIVEKGMGMQGPDEGMALPGDGPGDGMMPPPGGPPPGEDGMRIFDDNIIWFKFFLQDAGISR